MHVLPALQPAAREICAAAGEHSLDGVYGSRIPAGCRAEDREHVAIEGRHGQAVHRAEQFREANRSRLGGVQRRSGHRAGPVQHERHVDRGAAWRLVGPDGDEEPYLVSVLGCEELARELDVWAHGRPPRLLQV
jgi:hypothetical protein